MSQFYNNVKTAFFLGILTALIMLIGSFWGQNGMIIALGFAAVMNFVSYFFSDKIAIATMRGQELGAENELYQIVQELTRKVGMPMPRVYVSPEQAPNAFATGRNPRHAAVCATQGLLDMLDRKEIAGVMGHELSHVRHRDILIQSVAATIAAAISFIAWNMRWFGLGRNSRDEGGANLVVVLLISILGPVAALLVQAAISRSREFNADAGGAELVGDPMALATALEKIDAASRQIPLEVNPAFNSMFIMEPRGMMGTIAGMFQTHPPLEARLMNLIGRETTGRFGYSR